MSELKSAWELSLEKSNKMVPEANRKLSPEQKQAINDIRKEYRAKIADKDISLQHKLKKLSDRVPPERLREEAEKLQREFAGEKERLEREMEQEVEQVHSKKR